MKTSKIAKIRFALKAFEKVALKYSFTNCDFGFNFTFTFVAFTYNKKHSYSIIAHFLTNKIADACSFLLGMAMLLYCDLRWGVGAEKNHVTFLALGIRPV